MDHFYTFRNEIFCWDTEKASANLMKHGITFEQACEVFADTLLLIEDATVADEVRFVATGLTLDWQLTCVVHMVRENDVVRIISARRATSHERDLYEDNA